MVALAEIERRSSSPLPLAEMASPVSVSVSWPGTGYGNKAFTGREWDPETGLYYYRARYYDPQIGRFISEDPSAQGPRPYESHPFDDLLNPYRYAADRPTLMGDPQGRAAAPIVVGGGIAIWTASCYRWATNSAKSTFPGHDKKQHCFAACRFNRCLLLLAPHVTFAGQIFHEVITGFSGGDYWDSAQDTAAAAMGIGASYLPMSCKTSCNRCSI